MLTANQSAVMQTTNVAMVKLRSIEVQYFAQFFASIGTQSAIVAGIVVTGIPRMFLTENDRHYTKGYWLTITCASLTSLAALLFVCTLQSMDKDWP